MIVIGSSLAGVMAGLGVATAIQRLQRKSWPKGTARLDKAQVYPAAQAQIIPAVAGAAQPGAAGMRQDKAAAGLKTSDKPAEKKKNDTLEQYLKSRAVPAPKASPGKVPPTQKTPPPPPPRVEPIRRSPPPPKMEPVANKTPPPAPRLEPPPKAFPPPPPRVEPAPLRRSELVREVEANLAVAVTASAGRLAAFQSSSFDSSRSRLAEAPAEILDSLTEAYTDIRLANTLVWLSKDLGRQSSEMEGGYLRLCGKIAERLQKVLPDLLRSGL